MRHTTQLSRTIGVILLLSALAFAPAGAASMPKGTVELSTDMLFDHYSYSVKGKDKGSSSNFNLVLGAGPCLTDALQFKAALEIGHSEATYSAQSSEATSWGGSARFDYNFTTQGATIPFVEAGLGVRFYAGDGYDSTDPSTILPILGLGLRFLVRKSVSLNTELSYQRISNVGGATNLTASGILLGVGFSVLLEPKPRVKLPESE
jgi:hypothetical protein